MVCLVTSGSGVQIPSSTESNVAIAWADKGKLVLRRPCNCLAVTECFHSQLPFGRLEMVVIRNETSDGC